MIFLHFPLVRSMKSKKHFSHFHPSLLSFYFSFIVSRKENIKSSTSLIIRVFYIESNLRGKGHFPVQAISLPLYICPSRIHLGFGLKRIHFRLKERVSQISYFMCAFPKRTYQESKVILRVKDYYHLNFFIHCNVYCIICT